MGGIISGIFGGGSSPGQDAQMQGLKASREDIQAYRPEAMQARLNLLSDASSPYQGANNALETMYGGAPPPGVGGFGASSGSRRLLGHDLPMAYGKGDQGAQAGAQEGAQDGAPHAPQRPQIGQGSSWEDTAAQLIDPGGIFRRFF
jgi:hypothetical protein